ncbi:hypothetical protein BC008_44275 [Mastigocoleus testarum BC008]|uniref:Uncharacterized protein n=1 Tax=Mastigocoleus testarum BC008 TaxID=371196 RepID=A0A0V7ZUA6_9CYAN|nr:hypothetical protein BC008_44275 [Mastigocoleus testarum BC008]
MYSIHLSIENKRKYVLNILCNQVRKNTLLSQPKKRGTSLLLLANPVCRSLKRGEHLIINIILIEKKCQLLMRKNSNSFQGYIWIFSYMQRTVGFFWIGEPSLGNYKYDLMFNHWGKFSINPT